MLTNQTDWTSIAAYGPSTHPSALAISASASSRLARVLAEIGSHLPFDPRRPSAPTSGDVEAIRDASRRALDVDRILGSVLNLPLDVPLTPMLRDLLDGAHPRNDGLRLWNMKVGANLRSAWANPLTAWSVAATLLEAVEEIGVGQRKRIRLLHMGEALAIVVTGDLRAGDAEPRSGCGLGSGEGDSGLDRLAADLPIKVFRSRIGIRRYRISAYMGLEPREDAA